MGRHSRLGLARHRAARKDREVFACPDEWVFFDRGQGDAMAALQQHASGEPVFGTLGPADGYRYRVFLTPPWPEIYVENNERRHGLSEAIAQYDRLLSAYGDLGYETIILPNRAVGERADFLLRHLKFR